MAPLLLEGETLGEKRKHYNKLVNEATINKILTTEIPPLNFEEEDIDNLFKIDIACNYKNVDYILGVFKCEDMLYVSRAIKQSKWLINESQYAHVINPEYLFNELFPHMTSKAKNKLLLTIRLNLRDELRVEDFCKYLMCENIQMGLKWLPFCSDSFIEETIKKHCSEIPKSLMIRLCKRSIYFFEIYTQNCNNYNAAQVAQEALFLLKQNAEKYLDIVEPTNHQYRNTPQFNSKATQKLMKKCPKRIINNFEIYSDYINMREFAKLIKKNELKNFILKHMENKLLQFSFINNIQHFLKRLPSDEKFEFVKVNFMNKSQNHNKDDIIPLHCCGFSKKFGVRDPAFTSANVYRWCIFAPYNIAFKDLKKLIKTESNPSERNAMLTVILQCAGKDIHNIQSLVQYYRENHINEPFKFKIHFINNLLSKSDVCSYDSQTWCYLNNIFTSMEVYEESNNDVQSCIKCVILYNLIHNNVIPKSIENKFVFDTLKTYQMQLGSDNKEKVFNYLYKHQTDKLNKLTLMSERECNEAFSLLKNILHLLNDWNKNLSEYPMIIEKIKTLISSKNKNVWNVDISKLYHIMKKSSRRLFFNELIFLNPTAEVAIHALKHDPEPIKSCIEEIWATFSNENMQARRFLYTIRIFWSQSLAVIYKNRCFESIDKKTNYNATIFGLSILLPQKEFLELIHKHVPAETKIDWSQNEPELSFRRNLAKKLHLARPQIPLSAALLYAKGDYLQYVLPSLNSILYNISSLQVRDQIMELLNAPVSLQKHGIRAAIRKLQHDELKLIFTDLWNSTKNYSIRADVLKETFKLLCKGDVNSIDETWSLLKIFISNLTEEENKNIYATLCRINQVPSSIKADFWMTSYNFFKGLPEKANSSILIDKLINKITDVITLLDPDFIAGMYLEILDKKVTKEMCNNLNYLAIYLLSTESINIQNTRYHKVLLPILDKAFSYWDVQHDDGPFYARSNIKVFFKNLLGEFKEHVLDKNMSLPVVMFSNAYIKLNNDLPHRENYCLITLLRLSQSYVKILNDILKIKSRDAYQSDVSRTVLFEWKLLHKDVIPEFGKVCLEYLKEDVSKFFPSIYLMFANALEDFCDIFDSNDTSNLILLQTILEIDDFKEAYLVVLRLIPLYVFGDATPLKLQILNKIKDHPSEQVKMHYWQRFS